MGGGATAVYNIEASLAGDLARAQRVWAMAAKITIRREEERGKKRGELGRKEEERGRAGTGGGERQKKGGVREEGRRKRESGDRRSGPLPPITPSVESIVC